MNNKNWLFISIIFPLLLLTSNLVYSEGDKDELESLKGLKGVYVLVESIPPGIKEEKFTNEQIQADVESKLRLAGIKVVPGEERFGIPGWPTLYINVNAILQKEGLVIYNIHIQLEQNVYLKRDTKTEITATTWSNGSIGVVGLAKIIGIRDSIKDMVDIFINDYLSVNPKGEK
jgi:hypothetical protein